MKKIRLILLFSLITISVSAQDKLNYNYINTQTYTYYQQKEWDKLIELGKLSLEKGIDFYYLQTRMGIAYYEKKQYGKAVKYFETAFERNPDDDIIAEYLYFSYLYSGRYADARVLVDDFKVALKQKVGFWYKGINNIGMFGLYIINPEEDMLKARLDAPADSLYREHQYDKSRHIYGFSLEHDIEKKVLMTYQYSKASSDEKQQIKYKDADFDFNNSSTQSSFYVRSRINFKKGLNLNLAANILSIKSENNLFESETTTSDYTAYNTYSLDDGTFVEKYDTIYDYFDNIQTAILPAEDKHIDIALSASLWKSFPSVKLGMHFSYYKINSSEYIQPALTFVYYPFSNLNLYSVTTLNDKIDQIKTEYTTTAGNGYNPITVTKTSNSYDHSFIFSQTIGFKLSKTIWSEFSFKKGDMYNYADNEAQIVYNLTENVSMQVGLGFIVMLNKRLKLNLNYSLIRRDNVYLHSEAENISTVSYPGHSVINLNYTDGTNLWLDPITIYKEKTIYEEELKESTTSYSSHLITGGLQWYF